LLTGLSIGDRAGFAFYDSLSLKNSRIFSEEMGDSYSVGHTWSPYALQTVAGTDISNPVNFIQFYEDLQETYERMSVEMNSIEKALPGSYK
jgi:hypothetical protein